MTDDEQEAQSLKYSDEVRMVLILSSGKIALYGNDRKLHGIYDNWEQVATCYKFVQVEHPKQEVIPVMGLGIDLEDLGI